MPAVNIYITGIGGFLGSALAADLTAAGHAVAGSNRHTLLTPVTLTGTDIVIHAAHDFTPGAVDCNIATTTAWFRTARDCNVHQQIFLSSCSAGSDSEYGRIKQALERLFVENGECLVRPGLVMGEGGLFARQRAGILSSPVIPMISGGRQPVAVLSLDEFLRAMRRLIDRDLRGEYTLYREPMPTYREFVTGIKREAGQKPRLVNVPLEAALAITGAFERFRLPFPVKPGQIRALQAGPRGQSVLQELLS